MKSKLLASMALIGVALLVLGNILDNATYWIYSDIYVGITLLFLSWKMFKG